nr:28S ribosomal protein S18a, mitochondrial-like [Cherax quadricarinatus]
MASSVDDLQHQSKDSVHCYGFPRVVGVKVALRNTHQGSRDPVCNLLTRGSPQPDNVLSPTNFLKEIVVQEEGQKVTIEGVYKDSPRIPLLVKTGYEDCQCAHFVSPLNLKHTDVLILSQFMRADGCLLPKRVTGLCSTQQRRLTLLVRMSQKAGLMPNLAPSPSKRDPTKRYGSKKYNRYFDEATLDVKPKRRFRR